MCQLLRTSGNRGRTTAEQAPLVQQQVEVLLDELAAAPHMSKRLPHGEEDQQVHHRDGNRNSADTEVLMMPPTLFARSKCERAAAVSGDASGRQDHHGRVTHGEEETYASPGACPPASVCG